MSSAVKLILGVSILATAAGFAACGSSTSDPAASAGAGVVPTGTAGSASVSTAGATSTGSAGATSTGTAGATSGGGSTGTAGSTSTGGAPDASGIPLSIMGGWVSGMDNTAMIQGAVFAYADPYSIVGLTSNVLDPADKTATNACMKGMAAKVDMMSAVCMNKTFTPPAMDCYGEYWGAAIGLNLNQPIDMTTGKGGIPAAYDASMLQGFAFDISGTTIPAPKDFRFKVEDSTGEYCTPAAIKILSGTNVVKFTDLRKECYHVTVPPQPTADTAQSHLIKIAWAVVTNISGAVPFDFCISNVRAIPK